MRPQSAKAKGRRLQQEVRDAILSGFSQLEPDDVRSTSMGASGADLLLSPAAKKVFPYAVECGNQERINIWDKIAQAEKHASTGTASHPLTVIRKNNTPAYAVIRFERFMELARCEAWHE